MVQLLRFVVGLLKVSVFSDVIRTIRNYEGWNFNSGNYLFTTDTE